MSRAAPDPGSSERLHGAAEPRDSGADSHHDQGKIGIPGYEDECFDDDEDDDDEDDDDDDDGDGDLVMSGTGGGSVVEEVRINSPEDAAALQTLVVKWGKEVFNLKLNPERTSLGDLKHMLCAESGVLPGRQKLVGIKFDRKLLSAPQPQQQQQEQQLAASTPGVAPEDVLLLSLTEINWKKGIIMLGVPEVRLPKKAEVLPEVLDDLDFDYEPSEQPPREQAIANPKYRSKLRKLIRTTSPVNLIHPLRRGKPLLVLDIDYTIFDMRGDKDNMEALKRPGTDEFLTVMYRHFDLCFWSQTSWRWIELKLTEMGLLTSPTFRIAFVLDKTCMFKIKGTVGGVERKHYVKPLHFIWHHFPQLNERNTVHVDDLGRNFALNPRCGVKISPYKKADQNKGRDFELPLLTEYLLACEQSERGALAARNRFRAENRAGAGNSPTAEQLDNELDLDDDYDLNRHPHHGWQQAVLRLKLAEQQ